MTVTSYSDGGAVVLALSGVADEALLLLLAKGVHGVALDAQLVIVDVRDVVLSDVNGLRAFLAHLLDGPSGDRVAFVCDRVSGRLVLRRFGSDDLPMFDTVSEAVENLAAPV